MLFEGKYLMSRTKKFLYNTIASAFQQIVLVAVGLTLPRIMLVYYGSEINGITSSIRQFINYFTLVEAGVGASAIFALYKPLAKQDQAAISSIAAAARRFYIQSGYVFTGLTVVLALCFPLIRQTTELSYIDLSVLVLILGAKGFLNFFLLSKYNVILTADQKSYVIAGATSVSNLLSAAAIISLACLNAPVVTAYAVSLISFAVQSLILFRYTRKHYSYLDFHAEPDNSSLNQRWDALYLQILGLVQVGAPVILATFFLDYKAVSVYSVYYMVMGGINGLLGIFTSGLSASFGDVIARGETETLQNTYQEFEFTYYAVITVVYACALVLIMPFIRLYTSGITDADYDVPLIGILMVVNGYLYNLKTPQGMLVISAGLYRETRWRTTIQGAIALFGGLILAPFFGLAGIIVGSILSNLYRDIDLLFFIPQHVTKLSPQKTAKRWVISLFEFVLILAPRDVFPVQASDFGQWAIWGIIWCLYAFAVVAVGSMIFDRDKFTASAKRIIGILGARQS
jgi:hypothetical protein